MARNPPLRVEFEHATVFGSFVEALSLRKGKTSWGALLGIEPIRVNEVLHPTRVLYILKETSRMRQRWEFRDTLKRILGRSRYLVGRAVRQTKREFVAGLSNAERTEITSIRLTPEAFWQASRFGERFGPNGIHAFVQRLEEQTKGYRLNFPEAADGTGWSQRKDAFSRLAQLPVDLLVLLTAKSKTHTELIFAVFFRNSIF